jgi:prevent-host-death family protein
MRRNNMSKILKTKPQVIMKNGRPNAVIIDIKDYKQLLERLEDKEDIADLEKMRKSSLHFRKFDDFLTEHNNAI